MKHKFDTLAITGGIGSGKSTVLNLFEKHGYYIVNLDKLGHEMLDNTSPYYLPYAQEIDNWLGTNYVTKEKIERSDIRNKLLEKENGFYIIGQIAQKYIVASMSSIYEEYKKSNKKIVFEVPLLTESQMENYFKDILVIVADIDIRKERIKKRDPHLTDKDIENRISLQASDEQRIAVANYVIDNSGTEDSLNQRFEEFLQQYEKQHAKKFYI